MSGVLHPVGPEPERVYWVRRVIVVAAAVLALVLVIAVIANLNSAASASGPEVDPAAPPATSTSSGTASSAANVPLFSPDPSTPAPSGAVSSGAVPSGPAARSSAAPSKSKSAGSTASGTPSTSVKPSTSSSAKSDQATANTGCNPGDLRQTLTGDRNVKVKKKTSFDLSLINGSSGTCQLKLSSDNFTLTIYSGSDRIWSSADCSDSVKAASTKIKSQDAYEWSMTWNGLRSAKNCKTRPEIPRPGTYVATAHFEGADPVTFRMFLTK